MGTVRYASVNTLRGVRQSRRDDLESLAYTLIYMHRGSLPWQGLPEERGVSKSAQVLQKKLSTSPETLCSAQIPELAQFLTYCRGLAYSADPDYPMLWRLFKGLTNRLNATRANFDWVQSSFPSVELQTPTNAPMNIQINDGPHDIAQDPKQLLIADRADNIKKLLAGLPTTEQIEKLALTPKAAPPLEKNVLLDIDLDAPLADCDPHADGLCNFDPADMAEACQPSGTSHASSFVR